MAKEPSALARKVSGELVGDGESLAIGLTRAEVDQQIATAKKYPRVISKVLADVIEFATLNEEGAASMIYEKPQGGDTIQGASIRFAELLAQSWGNARTGARTVHVDTTEKFVEAEGIFHDLQTNLAISRRVRRSIRKRDGSIFSEDMILTVANAAGSIALRNAILGGIPKPVWSQAYEAAKQVVRGELGTLAKRRSAALNYLKTKGVEPARALAAIGIKNEADMTLDHMASLRVRVASIQSGEPIDEMFPPIGAPAAPVKTNVADKLPPKTELPKTADKAESGGFDAKRVAADIDTASPPKEKDAPAAEETPHDPKTGEVIEGEVVTTDDEPTFGALALVEGKAPRGESYTLIDDEDDDNPDPLTLALYMDGVEVGRVTAAQSEEYNAYTEHALTDDEAAALPQTDVVEPQDTQVVDTSSTDLPDGWEVLKDVDGPAPIGEETYVLAGDMPDAKTGRLVTYQNGKSFSSTSKAGVSKFIRYTAHPVIEGGKGDALGEDESFPGDQPATRTATQDGPDQEDDGSELPGAFGVFWKAAFDSPISWEDFVKTFGALNAADEWKDKDFTDEDRDAFRSKIAIELAAANRLPDVTGNITAFRLWMESVEGEAGATAIENNFRALKGSDSWAKWKAEKQAAFRETVELRLAKIRSA